MISFHFKIVPAYLAYHMIVNTSPSRFVGNQCDSAIVDFQNAAWHKDTEANDFIRFGPQEDTFIFGKSMEQLSKRADALLKEMLSHQTFGSLLAETAQSLDLVRTEWESNFVKTNDMVSEMTGLELTRDVDVYLTHPKLKQGHAGHGFICWAYRLTWPNYNTVYLWHEFLHLVLPGGDLEHAAIQLIADNEMRTRLNGGEYPPFEAHEEHKEMMTKLLPAWRDYLKRPQKDIHDFIDSARRRTETVQTDRKD